MDLLHYPTDFVRLLAELFAELAVNVLLNVVPRALPELLTGTLAGSNDHVEWDLRMGVHVHGTNDHAVGG